MRLPAVLTALAAVLATAAMWLVLAGDPVQAAGLPAAKGPPGGAPPPPGPAVEAVESVDDPTAEGRTAVEVQLEPVAAVIPIAPWAIRVTNRGLPIHGASVQVVAGAQALGDDPRATGAALVRIELPDGEVCFRRVDLSHSAVELDMGGAISLAGRVLDREGQPLSARVWCGQGEDWAATDEAGRFRFDFVRGSAGVPVIAVAEGHASSVVYADPRRDLEIRLGDGCLLDVGALGAGARFERVVVVPAGERQTALLAYPFFLDAPELDAVRARLCDQAPWVSAGWFEGDGARASLAGLPVGARVRAVALADGRAPARSGEVRLGPGANRAHVSATAPGIRQSGTALGSRGQPAVGALVIAAGARGRPGPWLLCPEAASVGPIARVDGQGHFEIETGGPLEIWGHAGGDRASGLRPIAPSDQRPWTLPPAFHAGCGESSFEVVGLDGPFAVRVDSGRWRASTQGVALTEGWRRPAVLDVHAEIRLPDGSVVARTLSSVLAVGTTALDLR